MLYRHVLALACFAAFLSWLFSRGWRRLPLFGVYLAAQLPLLVGYRPENDAWLASWWVWWQPAVLVARAGATVEAYWVHSEELADRRTRILMGGCLLLLAVAMMSAGWFFVDDTTVRNIVQARRLVLVGCVAFLLFYILPVALRGLAGTGWRLRHMLLHFSMLAVLLTVVLPSMGMVRHQWDRETWHAIDDWANAVTAGLLLTWATLVPQAARRDAQGLDGPPRDRVARPTAERE